MTFRANKSGTWVGGDDQSQGTVVYGKSGGNWLYAKEVFAKKDGTWTRAWTDCRKHDEGGRDWSASAGVTEHQGSCSTRQSRVRTDYTKTGCTGYSGYTSWVSSPDCGAVGTSCWTNVTCNYLTSTNFVFAGITFQGVFDIVGDGVCIAYRDDNCFYSLWTCGSTQGLTSVCF